MLQLPHKIAHIDSSPHFWQVLVYIDAHLTETFIDSLGTKTHRLIEHPNIKIFLKLPSNQKTYTMIRDSYIASFQNLDLRKSHLQHELLVHSGGGENLTGIGNETITNIAAGEEITVSYADNYFGNRNEQCLSSTCRKCRKKSRKRKMTKWNQSLL